MKDPRVDRRRRRLPRRRRRRLRRRDDIAVLRRAGLERAARARRPGRARPVAILGYPESGPFTRRRPAIGQTGRPHRDAYGRGPSRAGSRRCAGRPPRELRRAGDRLPGMCRRRSSPRAIGVEARATPCRRARRAKTAGRARPAGLDRPLRAARARRGSERRRNGATR
jgi:hypothetical protein